MSFINLLDSDRHEIVKMFDRCLDKIKKGAIYFISMTLWGTDINMKFYPIN